jgi:hypothetical protein
MPSSLPKRIQTQYERTLRVAPSADKPQYGNRGAEDAIHSLA